MIANWAVTYRCNGRCSYCGIWKHQPRGDELTLSQITGFLEANREHLAGLEMVQVTGGEPFLRSDLPEIVAAIKDVAPGCFIWVPTNGLEPRIVDNVEEMLETCRDLGVSVSIDGVGEAHDVQRGVEGGYVKAVETLRGLSGLRDRHPALRASVGFTLTGGNLLEASAVQELAYGCGADFSLRPVNYSDIYYLNPGEPRTMVDVDVVLRRVAGRALREKGLRGSASFLAYLKGVQRYCGGRARLVGCTAGSGSVFIDPYGDVYPCIVFDRKLGNITENLLRDILGSVEAEKVRKEVAGLRCPGCWVECEAYRELRREWLRVAPAVVWSLLEAKRFS